MEEGELLLNWQQVLRIAELQVQRVLVKEQDDRVEIQGELLLRKAVCPGCGEICQSVHQYRKRTVRHAPLCARRCEIVFEQRQFECEACGKTFCPPLGFLATPDAQHTRLYAQYLFERVRGSSIRVLAEQEGIPEKTLEAIYYVQAGSRDEVRALKPTRAIGVDEISVKKGHGRFRCVIYDLERGEVIDMLENREKATLVAWFRRQPKAWLDGIEVVAMDLWEGYRQAVREVFGERGVDVVADKFHVVKLLNEKMQECRRAIQREASEKVRQELKGLRWAFLKAPRNLSPEERRDLQRAFRHSPELKRIYELKQEFIRIYRPSKRSLAIRRLGKWMKKAEATGIERLVSFVRTLRRWWREVLAYFQEGWTNAGSEGVNTTIKMVMRRGYGFRNMNNFRLRILHETGALQEAA